MRTTLLSWFLLLPALVQAQTTLLFTLGTGRDDLRGGNDNVNVTVLMRSGVIVRFDNVNERRRLSDNTLHSFRRTLPANATANDVASISLETTFGGGIAGDNWNLDQFQVTTEVNGNRTTLINQRGSPLFRFTFSNRMRQFLINPATPAPPPPPPPPLRGLMLDADFRRVDVPAGLLDNSSRPPYAEPLVIPAKPFPGSIVGDFFAIRGNSSFFSVGADAQDVDAPKFLLVPHLPAGPTHYPYVDFIGQSATPAIASRQFRATLIFKAVNEVRDAVRFIINDPNEAIVQDGLPNGLLSVWLQNGRIFAKTDDGAQGMGRQIGSFQVNVPTKIEVNFSLQPSKRW